MQLEVLLADGPAERDAALVMMEAIPSDQPVTVGADKRYDRQEFVAEARAHEDHAARGTEQQAAQERD